MRSFSDAKCENIDSLATVPIDGITILQDTMPATSVKVGSNTNILGNSIATNTLSVTFTPKTRMSPNGKGTIHVGVPYWYKIGTTGERMYSATAENKCSSTCMTVTYSKLQGGTVVINYEDMKNGCMQGSEITINCKQFYNPITPDLWPGFSVTIYDSDINV